MVKRKVQKNKQRSTKHIYTYITVFTVFRLLTDFVCLYNYEFWLSLCKIVRSSVILVLPLYTTKDRVTRTSLKTEGEFTCSGRVGSYCSTSDTHRVYLVTTPVISHEWWRDREVLTTSGTNPWSFVTQILHNGQPSHGGDGTTFVVMTSTQLRGTLLKS
jgi:hypothetical protein